MIDINDYNREDLIASCLMEAAQVMSESYGAHGVTGKYLKNEYDKEKKRNDKHDAEIEKKQKAYERAGYTDKLPRKADRYEENLLKKSIDYDKAIRKDPERGKRYSYKKPSEQLSHMYSDTYRDDILDRPYIVKFHEDTADRNARKKELINRRINERAERAKKAMGESVEERLAFADALLDLLDE